MNLLLLLAQAPEADAGNEALLGLVYVLAFVAVFVFVFTGYLMFAAGWESYEEKYIEGAERSIDDLFLTIPPQQLLWLSVLGALALFTLGVLASGSLLFGIALGIPGFFLARIALAFMRKARLKKFNEQLVEAMVTMTNALRSGVALPKAFAIVAHDMPKPICQEFGILVQEMRIGMDVEEAMLSLLDRMPGADLELVCTSVSISNSVGGNLAEVFERLAETIRERYRIEGRIDSLTAQGKMQGMLVSALPVFVGVMIWFLDPDLMEPMFTRPIGIVILICMAVMEVLGYLCVRWVTSIEV